MYNSQNLPLSPKKVIKKTIARYLRLFWVWIWLIFFGAFSILPFFSARSRLYGGPKIPLIDQIILKVILIGLAILFFPLIPIVIYEYFYYKFYYYDFAEDRAKIKKGVISQATGFVRYERLQNIYVDQDILDRIFGLYDVHYETAGERSGFYSHVDGLNKENADKLVAFLEEKAKQPIPSQEKEKKEITKQEPVQEKIEGKEISIREYPLSRSIIIVRTIVLSIVFSILFSCFGIFLLAFNAIGIFLMGFLVIFVLCWIYNQVWYKNFYFHFGQEKGEIRSKVIGQSISYLYYDRIQNVNLSQSALGRLFGIYTITIETAGEKAWMRLVIDGLPKEGAEKVKEFLLEKARYYRGRL